MNRKYIPIAIAVALALITALVPRLPQDPAYHHFADTRAMLGVPNALDVLSNVPFLLIGVLGLRLRPRETGFYFCFAGIALTAFGSAWYHLNPNNATLVWDRLPMAVGFMGLLDAVIAERISERAAMLWLTPLLCLGAGSVIYWQARDDLRPYVLVQFGPLVLIAAMVALFPSRQRPVTPYVLILGWYVVAKILEAADAQVYALGEIVSGHTLKHLAAAWACYEIVRMVARQQSVEPA